VADRQPPRALLDALPEAIAVVDTGGRLRATNAALRKLLGPAVALRAGEGIETLVAPRDRLALAVRLAGAASGELVAPLLVRPADPNAPAEARWVFECLPVVAGGQVLIRVQDRSIERRAAARAEASARLEAIGRLAGGIAHDFNNLLAIMLSATEAARAAGVPPVAAEELDHVEAAARRGADLVRQLLAFARQQPLQPRVLDLNPLVATTAPMLQRLMGPRIPLELSLERTPLWVSVDPGQVDQILLNLSANARHAMPEGGRLRITTGHVTFAVPVGPLPAGDWAVLEVDDTGRGIPPEVLSQLFEPFFTTRPDKGGTGLGLATVQGIVAQSHGHITVDSQVGEGTRFRVFLPAAEPPAEPAPLPAVAAPEASPASVWLVEDEPPLRRLSTLLLERAGHAVRSFEDAEAALEAAEAATQRPAALLTDVAMPGLDGLALAQRLRARWPGLPVVVMSGYAEQVSGGALAGTDFGFVSKPFVAGDLLAALARVLVPAL